VLHSLPYRVTTTVVRHQLSKRELLRLDGAVPLPRDTVVDFGDGRVACVVTARLVLFPDTDGDAQLVIEVQGG
jgi:hypothetical protein